MNSIVLGLDQNEFRSPRLDQNEFRSPRLDQNVIPSGRLFTPSKKRFLNFRHIVNVISNNFTKNVSQL